MPGITLDPTTGAPKTHLDVKCVGFDPNVKIVLETVDPDGVVSGYNANGESTNQNRPMRDGSLSAGILSPPKEGISKVRALQNGLVVATATFTGQVTSPVPTVDTWSSRPVFGSRTTSNVIRIVGQSNFTISGKKFAQQIGHDIVSIRLEQCSNFKIIDNDFDSDTEPIFLYQCSDFELGWLRAKNIVGPNQRDGTHRGNLVQMDTCTKFLIHDCKIKGGDTEDVISMFKSGGRSATDMSVVDKIQMEMTGWKSGSGTGIILGDAGGGYIEVMNSMLLNPGQVGIQIIDGPGLKVHDNIIYSAKGQIAPPNVGISSYGGNPIADVYNNKVKWFKNDGSENPYWFGAGSITNRTSNQWHAAIDPNTLTVVL